MNIVRRNFLSLMAKGFGAIAAISVWPSISFAGRNDKAFTADAFDKAVGLRYPGLSAADSDKITLKAPAIAENGAVVPVTVKTSLPKVTNISLFVEKNPSPQAASFNLGPLNEAEISIRVRMGKTSNLVAMVVSDGKLYKTQQEVKVTIGGCGG